MLTIPNHADGSASVVLRGELVKVSEKEAGKSLAALLEEIAQLDLRVATLEKMLKKLLPNE